MLSLVNYIKTCFGTPTDGIVKENELCVCMTFDKSKFDNLIQDGIMISGTQPTINDNSIEYIKLGELYFCRKIYRELAWLNQETENMEWDNTRTPLYRRIVPTPWETVDHGFIIEEIIKNVSDHTSKNYIEYGVRDGIILNRIAPLVKTAYGVDLNPTNVEHDNIEFTQCYTDEYSINHLPSLEYYFAFIDADHKFESVNNDFMHIYKNIQSGGIIFLHDTYPCCEQMTSPMGSYNCYKTPIQIKKDYPGIEILTLPLNPGVTIIRKS